MRALVRSSSDAVVILDDDLRIGWTSSALERALGPDAAGLTGRSLLEAVHPEDAAAVAVALALPTPDAADVPGDSGLLLLRLRDSAGSWRSLEAAISDLRRDPDVGAVVLCCRDLTERHARELALQSVAYTDPLTGLPNRAGFRCALGGALEAAGERSAALLVIELDGVEAARQSGGRAATTEVIAEIGRRLRATVRGEDVVARLGGGAFAVLSTGSPEDADRLASRCLSTIERPVVTTAGVVDLSAGVGVVLLEASSPDEGAVDELLTRADLAVRAAHATGPGTAIRYTDALGEAAARQDRLRADLPGAAARGELGLLYQPIVSLDSQRVTGIEAMLGWRHPVLGDVPTSEFLRLAERTGVVGELMRWALDEAAAAAAGLPAGVEPLRIGLKVPAGYVATGTMIPDVEKALLRSALAPERLVLQIGVDTMSSDDERIPLDVSSLRLMGVHVALHGFGGGTSALAHLTALPIDTVRLDRSFITRLDRDPQSRALCESVVGIAKSLGLSVVGDGVETPAQLAALCGFGADFAQGFLIARPMPLADLRTVLAESAGALWPGRVASA